MCPKKTLILSERTPRRPAARCVTGQKGIMRKTSPTKQAIALLENIERLMVQAQIPGNDPGVEIKLSHTAATQALSILREMLAANQRKGQKTQSNITPAMREASRANMAIINQRRREAAESEKTE